MSSIWPRYDRKRPRDHHEWPRATISTTRKRSRSWKDPNEPDLNQKWSKSAKFWDRDLFCNRSVTSACGRLNLISIFRRARLDLLDPQNLESSKVSNFVQFQIRLLGWKISSRKFRPRMTRWLSWKHKSIRNVIINLET